MINDHGWESQISRTNLLGSFLTQHRIFYDTLSQLLFSMHHLSETLLDNFSSVLLRCKIIMTSTWKIINIYIHARYMSQNQYEQTDFNSNLMSQSYSVFKIIISEIGKLSKTLWQNVTSCQWSEVEGYTIHAVPDLQCS